METLHNKVVVLFDNITKDILTVLTPNNTNIDIENFINGQMQYNDKFKHLSRQDIGVSFIEKQEYQKNMSYLNSYIEQYINPETNEILTYTGEVIS